MFKYCETCIVTCGLTLITLSELALRVNVCKRMTVRCTFRADEAPADVDVAVVTVALLGIEVVGADDGVVGDHLAACSHAQISHVVCHRTAHASHHFTLKHRKQTMT